MTLSTIDQNTRFDSFIELLNKYTEIFVLPTGDRYEWNWKCKESDETFDTPENAILDCISFICRDREDLLIALSPKEDASDIE